MGLAQPNIEPIVSFDIGPRANGACMGSSVLEADAVVGCNLPGRRVSRDEYVVSIYLRRAPWTSSLGLISSSLRTGNPLPQVTPCPLLNRFMERPHGLNVVHEESEEDFGLPKVLTEETLESLQYSYVTVPLFFHYKFFGLFPSPNAPSQDFLCRSVNCVWYRDASGQVDGRS